MAGAYVGNSQTCAFTGTNLDADDANSGLLVKVTGALNAGSDGVDSVIPLVEKCGDGDRIYGVLENVNVSANRCSVQKAGIAKVAKNDPGTNGTRIAPVSGDIGSGLKAGMNALGTVNATEGRGVVVNYDGLGATNFLIVDLDVDAYKV